MSRLRSTVELACAVACGSLAVLTFTVHDWIEIAFGGSPDGGTGMTERATAVVLAVLSVTLVSDVLRSHRLRRQRARASVR